MVLKHGTDSCPLASANGRKDNNKNRPRESLFHRKDLLADGIEGIQKNSNIKMNVNRNGTPRK